MPREVRLWEVQGQNLTEVMSGKLGLEEHLEEWLENDISIISEDLLVIGRQVGTAFGKAIDLLGLNRNGDIVVVELKKDKTQREVIAQILEYASWVDDLPYENVESIANDYLNRKGLSLEEAFQKKFNYPLPDLLNESHEMLIVASDLDDQSERVIRYLSEYGIKINALTFNYFKKDEHEYIARVLLIPKSAVETRGTKRKYVPLSEENLRKIAEDNGAGELYSAITHGLESLFDSKGTTLSSVAFSGLQDGKMNTIFSIIPKESNKENGLKFVVYLRRFSKYFNITEDEAEKILPENRKEWKYYKSAPAEYSGFQGFFEGKEEIKTFLSKLQELKNRPKAHEKGQV